MKESVLARYRMISFMGCARIDYSASQMQSSIVGGELKGDERLTFVRFRANVSSLLQLSLAKYCFDLISFDHRWVLMMKDET